MVQKNVSKSLPNDTSTRQTQIQTRKGNKTNRYSNLGTHKEARSVTARPIDCWKGQQQQQQSQMCLDQANLAPLSENFCEKLDRPDKRRKRSASVEQFGNFADLKGIAQFIDKTGEMDQLILRESNQKSMQDCLKEQEANQYSHQQVQAQAAQALQEPYINYYKLNQNKPSMNNRTVSTAVQQPQTIEYNQSHQMQDPNLSSQPLSQQQLLNSSSFQLFEKSEDKDQKWPKPKSSEIQKNANDYCNAEKELLKGPAINKLHIETTQAKEESQINAENVGYSLPEALDDKHNQIENLQVAGMTQKKETNVNVAALISSSNHTFTQSVIHTKNNSTYETKNNENSLKEQRRTRRNNQEVIEQACRQRPHNQLIEIVDRFQKARQHIEPKSNIEQTTVALPVSIQQQSETGFQQEDQNQHPQKFQDSQQKLLIYQSSDEDEIMLDANANNQEQQIRPCLTQFLEEFEDGMKHFNESYRNSKYQFLKDMKTFNQADLNKEDEIIERSIKDSNYFPESNTPTIYPVKEKIQESQIKKDDIQLSQEASNFKENSQFIEIGKPNDLQIRQSSSFIPPKQTPSQLQLQSQPLSVGQSIATPQANQQNGTQLAQQNLKPVGLLTVKQQRSQTIHNYIQHLSEIYEGFQIQSNSLQPFYPSQVQRHLNKRKNQNTDRIVHGLANPVALSSPSRGSLSMRKQISAFESSPQGVKESKKHLHKMKQLTRCQANFIQVLFQKIDRRSKPIRKQEKELNENLKRKNIFLDQEGWDILNLLNKGKNTANQGQKRNNSMLNDRKDDCNPDGNLNNKSSMNIPQPEQQDVRMMKKILKSEKDRQVTIKQGSEKLRRMKMAIKQKMQQNKTSNNLLNDQQVNQNVFKIVSEKESNYAMPIECLKSGGKQECIDQEQDKQSQSINQLKDDLSIHQLVKQNGQKVESNIELKLAQQLSPQMTNGHSNSDQNVKITSKKQSNQFLLQDLAYSPVKSQKQRETYKSLSQVHDDVICLTQQKPTESNIIPLQPALSKSKVSIPVKRKNNKIQSMNFSENDDSKSKKNSFKKRYLKTQQKESDKNPQFNKQQLQQKKSIEKKTHSKKQSIDKRQILHKQHTTPQPATYTEKSFEKPPSISLQATEGAILQNTQGLELHTHHHQHQHHHTYYYHFHNLDQNYQVFQQHYHQHLHQCCPQHSGGQQVASTQGKPVNKCQTCFAGGNYQSTPTASWQAAASVGNQQAFGAHNLSIYPSFSSPQMMSFMQQPLIEGINRTSQNSFDKDEFIIPSREFRKKHQLEIQIGRQIPESCSLRGNQGVLEFVSKSPSPSISFKNTNNYNNSRSPRRICSPRPKLNGYMQSLTSNHTVNGLQGAAISPINRQSIKGPQCSHEDEVLADDRLWPGADNIARHHHLQQQAAQSGASLTNVGQQLSQFPQLTSAAYLNHPNVGMMIREEPYFLLQHVTISQPPEIGNFNNLKVSPNFDKQIESSTKRQKVEPKSATLYEQQDLKLTTQDNEHRFDQQRRIVGSDEIKNLIQSQTHSIDRKQETLNEQSNFQAASCSSSEADEDEDASSDDSEEENGSKSSSSSSSEDSDSSCDIDPILDSKSQNDRPKSFQANDCLNIIDSYESQQEQQQKKNEYQKFFNDINNKNNEKSKKSYNSNVQQPKMQIINSSQPSLTNRKDASEQNISSNGPKISGDSFKEPLKFHGQQSQQCQHARYEEQQIEIGVMSDNADHVFDNSGSAQGMSTPSFNIGLNKDYCRENNKRINSKNEQQSQAILSLNSVQPNMRMSPRVDINCLQQGDELEQHCLQTQQIVSQRNSI